MTCLAALLAVAVSAEVPVADAGVPDDPASAADEPADVLEALLVPAVGVVPATAAD